MGNHIMGKIEGLPRDFLGVGSKVSKAEFVGFVKRATDKSSPEYRELYFFLLRTFQAGDVMRTGEVDAVTFDRMIERPRMRPGGTAWLPRAAPCSPLTRRGSRSARSTSRPWTPTTAAPSRLTSGSVTPTTTLWRRSPASAKRQQQSPLQVLGGKKTLKYSTV